MDLYAYTQIEDLESILKDNNIEIARLRGIRLMRDEEMISQEEINKQVEEQKLENAVQWIEQRSWDSWCSWKTPSNHKALIYGLVPNEYSEEHELVRQVVGIRWNLLNRKIRNIIKLKNKKDEKQIRDNYNMFNSYVGKNVLYVHARQGGGNRHYYPIDTKHPMYLSDCDDAYDSTYCDIYYDLDKAVINNDK